MEQLKAVIRRMAAEIGELDETTLTDDEPFDALGLDSLQALELLVAIERHFDCQIPQEELKNFTDLNNVTRTVSLFVAPERVQA